MTVGIEVVYGRSPEPEPEEVGRLVALFNACRYLELERRIRSLVIRYPDSGLLWKVWGVSLQTQGKGHALPALQKAAGLLPNDAAVHNNLGVALIEHGKLYEAAERCCRAIGIRPDFTEAYVNLGNSRKGLGQLDDAETIFRRALTIKPDYAMAHSNLGATLCNLGRLGDAVVSLGLALEIKPDFAEAHNSLSVTLQQLGQFDESLVSCRRALMIRPDYALAHTNLGNFLQYLGHLDDAVRSYGRALAIEPDLSPAQSNLLFIDNYLPDQSAHRLLAEARHFGIGVAERTRPYTDWGNVRQPNRRLRIGLVSGDFNMHPVGHSVEALLAGSAANAVDELEFIGYPSYFLEDALTERIRARCSGWHSAVGHSDESLARQVRSDEIDILIDLAGHSAHNRLTMFALKPAPVQVSWLGYFATTGIAEIDYLIADPWTLPESEERHFTEKIWRLPETRLCFGPQDTEVEITRLPALDNGFVTFACCNNLTKMNTAVVALWAGVLRAIPKSRLLLKANQLKNIAVQRNVVAHFAIHGIAADRLILEGPNPRPAYLDTYGRVDIALDPFPYPGGATTVDALWMGVPVLTLCGDRFLSRQGVGLLMNAGLPEWIASDADDYVARAICRASDLSRLATVRSDLRERMRASPICDAPRFARHFDAACHGMWSHWCCRN